MMQNLTVGRGTMGFFPPLWRDDDGTGANARAALETLMPGARPGTIARRLHVLSLAFSLSVSPGTVYRWLRGGRPSRDNLARLREYVGQRQAQVAGARRLDRGRERMLREAHAHLLTDAERRRDAELIADIRRHRRELASRNRVQVAV